ncbi:MAG: murein hydrolase activator EnvC family protein [Bacteroidota bacterium]
MRILALILLLITSLLPNTTQAQSRKQLEAKRKKMQRVIAEQKKALSSTQKEKSVTLDKLNSLNQIIQQRQVVIKNLGMEIRSVNYELGQKQKFLDSLTKEHAAQQLKLKKTIIKAYKTRKSGREIAFVFSSKSISQAMRRWKYLRKISGYRRHQITAITAQAQSLGKAINQLEGVKQEKSVLMGENEKESKELETDKQAKQTLVKELSGKEEELRDRIRDNEKAIARLNNEISRLIAKEIEAERKRKARAAISASKARSGSGSSSNAGKENLLSPQARAIGGAFSKNKGNLPWPVERGFVSQTFGVHEHPDLEGITTVNNGVDITSPRGALASAVFEGTVSAILNIPGQGQAVLVNHGDFFTVYSHLSVVLVEKGQVIRMNQHIGKVMTDEDDKAVLQFQIWHGQEKQNPQSWLRGR